MASKTEESPTIHTAINAVMGSVGYVQKEKKQGLNYTFASEKALIEAIRPAMVENGIYMHVADLRNVDTKSYETKGGSTMNHTMITGVVRFSHGPSNTYIDSVAVGEGADVGDKSANKAMTAMYKYALRQTFCIETGDDPDGTSSETQQRAPRGKPAVPAQSAVQPEALPFEDNAPEPPKSKVVQKPWMKEANLAAKEAGSSIRATLKLGEQANPLIELDNWQTGNGYTDAEALDEFKKLIPVAVPA